MPENRSNVILDLIDVQGNTIGGPVRVELRNTRLRTLDQAFNVNFAGKPATLRNVPAFPNGAAELLLLPERYLLKKLPINVPAGRDLTVREMLFADPDRVDPAFPPFTKLPEDVLRLLRDSKFKADDWNSLDKKKKAGLMNICAKARTVTVASEPVTAFFHILRDVLPARIFVLVKPELHEAVMAAPLLFRPVPGGLHDFGDGFKRLAKDESFKTLDKAGNLQLTFARDTSGEGKMLVDADLDDHSGVQHAFDVLRHTITRDDTNPYNIHQILLHFQGIDPGYTLFR